MNTLPHVLCEPKRRLPPLSQQAKDDLLNFHGIDVDKEVSNPFREWLASIREGA